jgi:hypothetical protein
MYVNNIISAMLGAGKTCLFLRFKSVFEKINFFFQIKIFLVFLNHFDALISKLIFLKKYYFNIFLSEKHFKNTIVTTL